MGRISVILALLIFSLFSGATAEPTQTHNRAIVVFYFHRTVRCPSCTLLEALTRDAVALGFEQELKTGRIVMKAINVDEKEHEHFVDDYNLNAQSIVLSEIDNGKEKRWNKLDRIWPLLEDQEKLWGYLQAEIETYLTEIEK